MTTQINFSSHFVADITEIDTYSRGTLSLSDITRKNEGLLIRVEDCLIDEFSPIFMKRMQRLVKDAGYIRFSRIDCLARHQGKRASVLMGEEKLSEVDFITTAVFYPLYSYLTYLSSINYSVVFMHDDPARMETHPICSLLGFQVISPQESHFHRDALFISPFAEEGPDYLFPRSFNKTDMDLIFTLKL